MVYYLLIKIEKSLRYEEHTEVVETICLLVRQNMGKTCSILTPKYVIDYETLILDHLTLFIRFIIYKG